MTSPLATFATLHALRVRGGLSDSDTGDDHRLLLKLRAASAQIRRYTGREFLPVMDTRKFNYRKPHTLFFRSMDMLELFSVINGDGTTIDPTAILTVGTTGGIVGIELDPSLASFVYNSTPIRAITVQGIWGWHDDYATSWRYTYDNVPLGNLSASANTIAVSNPNLVDTWGQAPRFQVGQMLKIGSEYMFLVNVSGTTLTVVRGVHGTLAVAHNAGVPIHTYTVPADIGEITLRWAAWLIAIEDAGDYGGQAAGQTATTGLGRITVPPGLPADLRETLLHFRAITITGAV